MHLLLVPIGSAGDVYPFIGIARELKARGHEVTLFTSDHFRELIESLGIEFVSLARVEDFQSMIEDPRLWHPTRGFEFVARHAFLPLTPVVYKFVMDRYIPGKTLVVASSLALGALVAQDKAGIPVVTIHLQPGVFPSLYETPAFGGIDWIPRLPRPLKKAFFSLAYRWTDHILGPELNRFRASIGLGPVREILQKWIHSPLRVIGLFPDWFAAPQPDWPGQTRLTGFPLFDGTGVQVVPEDVEKFFAAGPPPVIFTLGSAMRHARRMFEIAAAVCRQLDCRGLFMNQFPDQIPASLPASILAIPYAPFSRLFPRAAVVVHHGGIGTTAQSLAAGVPQLVTPFAHDQFDNAARVVRLGVGEQLYAKCFSLPRLTEKLKDLLGDASRQARARALKDRLDGPEAIRRTCDFILSAVPNRGSALKEAYLET